jgi:hypothetical protein
MLRNDTSALFDRLREANVLLQEVLSGATQNLATIEGQLSTRVNDFVTALHEIGDRSGTASAHVEQQVKSFHDVTSSVLGDITSMASRFEEQAKTLTAAASALDQSHRRVETVLGERHTALDGMVNELGNRAENLDQRFTRFSGLLQESLGAAEARAREIARVIAEASTEGTRAIANQYDLVRATTEEERNRSVEALKSLFEETSNGTQTLLQAAADRFNTLVKEMKESAAAVQRDLDATRTEMRRGVLELPQDTAESAAQMRRVIVEQMDALAELNRIVARHSRTTEAEPARHAMREDAVAVGGGGFSRPAPRHDVQRAPAPTRRADPRSSEGRAGWLSDVLQRASREEAPAAAERTQASPLDALSLDIAHMVDHDAAVAVWEQRNRGEQVTYTRRLYTAQGQQTFEDIRRKYSNDRDFRQTVDRYIAEFERLLDGASRDERGPDVARNYIGSDTGKVYTMLAHAAGRFD